MGAASLVYGPVHGSEDTGKSLLLIYSGNLPCGRRGTCPGLGWTVNHIAQNHG